MRKVKNSKVESVRKLDPSELPMPGFHRKQGVSEVSLPVLFASSAMNALIAKADDKDTYEDIVEASWKLSDLMVAETKKRDDLPLGEVAP